jgi:hypothetical protein
LAVRRRRIAVPFEAGSRTIASLEDLKSLLRESPELLFLPARDGRLERFLEGISGKLSDCIDRNSPEDSIKRLAEMLGIEIKGSIKFDIDAVATSVEELKKALDEKQTEIHIAKGEFSLDEIRLESFIELIGQGKNETLIKVKELFAPYGIRLKSLTCEVEKLISPEEPKIEESYFHSSEKITSVATSTEELSKLLGNKGEKIYITGRNFNLGEAAITASSLIGQGREKTVLKFKRLIIPARLILENLTCEADFLVSPAEIVTSNAVLRSKTWVKEIGTLKWKFETGGLVISSPAIGSDGTVYVGSNDSYLYAINPDGTLKWKFETEGSVESSPAIGSDGTVYVGSRDTHLYAINPDGTLKWKFETEDYVTSSPAIGDDGTVYVGSDDGYLYAIYSDSPGPADSPWPMFRHDTKHTGRFKKP